MEQHSDHQLFRLPEFPMMHLGERIESCRSIFLYKSAHWAVHATVDIVKDILVVRRGGRWSWRMVYSAG